MCLRLRLQYCTRHQSRRKCCFAAILRAHAVEGHTHIHTRVHIHTHARTRTCKFMPSSAHTWMQATRCSIQCLFHWKSPSPITQIYTVSRYHSGRCPEKCRRPCPHPAADPTPATSCTATRLACADQLRKTDPCQD